MQSIADLRIGSEQHKELFCRVFIDGHDGYRPEGVRWPELTAGGRTVHWRGRRFVLRKNRLVERP